ncbi:unnamed protein product [Spirodela intermedia]|uniref:Uncharacterized protein n=1 Tax=Spirodela intermedia TaxID=51605 RepID=A0A7I8JN76_SPIIN|nr:unnamed protein product [Spirodela intermedia]CAA6671251.1 unnamed protein product [Spirodela intermedia]
MKYAFLGLNRSSLVIISSSLTCDLEGRLTILDIQGISLEVIKVEIIKWLEVGIIYTISDICHMTSLGKHLEEGCNAP